MQKDIILIATIIIAVIGIGLYFIFTSAPETELEPGEEVLPEEEKKIVCSPPVAHGKQIYSVSTKNNPRIKEVAIDPLDVQKEESQIVTVKIQEVNEKPITQVTGEAQTNKKSFPFSLFLIDGSDIDGTWQGSWLNQDTYCQNYMLIITVTSESGTSKVELAFK
jgi:hypothetical protein